MTSDEALQLCLQLGVSNDKIYDGEINLKAEETPHICQNVLSGNYIRDKQGYNYSWAIGSDFNEYIEWIAPVEILDKTIFKNLLNTAKKIKRMQVNINLEVKRQKGKTTLKFEIPEQLTEIFRENSVEIKESKSWSGYHFFYMPEITESESYKKILRQYNLIDDYGHEVVTDSRFNIAWLRTVEGKGQIQIKDSINLSVLSDMCQKTTMFLKQYYKEFFEEAIIKGVVTIEI